MSDTRECEHTICVDEIAMVIGLRFCLNKVFYFENPSNLISEEFISLNCGIKNFIVYSFRSSIQNKWSAHGEFSSVRRQKRRSQTLQWRQTANRATIVTGRATNADSVPALLPRTSIRHRSRSTWIDLTPQSCTLWNRACGLSFTRTFKHSNSETANRREE